MIDRFEIPRILLSGDPMPFNRDRNYKNMTEQQADRREQERVRVMLFGRELISDRIIGRWSEGVTGQTLCDHLYSGLDRDTVAENTVQKVGSIPPPGAI
jgi:hypothetical protein